MILAWIFNSLVYKINANNYGKNDKKSNFKANTGQIVKKQQDCDYLWRSPGGENDPS